MTYRNTQVARRLILAVGFCAWGLVSAQASILPRPLPVQNLTAKDGLSSDMILSIAVQGDEVWFGTYAGGATLYDTIRRSVKVFTTKGEPQDQTDDGVSIHWKNRLPYNHVSAIQVDADRVWFGTYFYGFGGGGISTYLPKSKAPWRKYSTFNSRAKKVVSLAVDPAGAWVGSERGLSFLDKKTGQWSAFHSTKDGLAGNFVNALLNETDVLWAGTNAGIGRFDKARKSWKTYGAQDGLDDLDIKALIPVGRSIWAGTSGGALFSYDRDRDRWQKIVAPDSLPKGCVNGLACSGALVFIARDDGVSICDTSSNRWDGLTQADGLVSDTVLCAAAAKDGVWFGTDQGASFLRMERQK